MNTPAPLTDADVENLYFTELDNRTLSFARAIEAEVNARWQKMLGDGKAVAWGMPDPAGNIVETIMPIDKLTDMKMWANQYKVPLFTHPAPDHTALLRQALGAFEKINSHGTVSSTWVDDVQQAITAIKESLNGQSK